MRTALERLTQSLNDHKKTTDIRVSTIQTSNFKVRTGD